MSDKETPTKAETHTTTFDDKGNPLPPLSELATSEDGYDHSKNPFRDPVVAEKWFAAYEKSKYECRHVFDPELTWTDEEERRLVRKIDWRVCLWAVSYR